MVTQKKCDTNQNVTKMGMIIKGIYAVANTKRPCMNSRLISTRSIATIQWLVNNILDKVQALNNLWNWVSNCKCAQDTMLSKRQGQQRYFICLWLASHADWVMCWHLRDPHSNTKHHLWISCLWLVQRK
jgi:hypothetical protein